MEHAPFIWAAYTAAAVILTWNALAPFKRMRRAVERIRTIARQEHQEEPRDDSHP